MGEMEDLQKLVDEDIANCEAVWAEYSHDKDKLQELFHSMLFRYSEKIEGFVEEILVISEFENSARMAEIYRENVKCLLGRLKAFRENGYRNEGLLEYQLKKEGQSILQFSASFSQIRIEIGMLAGLHTFEKEEIIKKLEEIEQITVKPISRAKKWDMLRPFVVWISGKDVTVALKLLPLLMKI